MKPESRTSPRRIDARERAAEALSMRKAGKSYRAIAAALGYRSPQAAFDAVQRAFGRLGTESAEDLRALELLRLDALWKVHFSAARQGDVAGTQICLRIMERRAKLLGLDAPTQAAVRAEHRVEGVHGVLVVPAPMSEDEWLAAAVKQQSELLAAERAVWSKAGGSA